ncbi:MAG: sigma-70 family RNA polymerase sigma factor [Bacteroidota bacterium]
MQTKAGVKSTTSYGNITLYLYRTHFSYYDLTAHKARKKEVYASSLYIQQNRKEPFVLLTFNLIRLTDDRSLQERIRQGHQRAMGALINKHIDNALIYAGRFAHLNPRHQPEDLVNLAFVRLINRIESGKNIDQVGAYLRKSIHNQHLDDLRQCKIKTLYTEDINELMPDADGFDQGKEAEKKLLDIIVKEVASMREDQQLIFKLRVFDRRDFEYIARELEQEVEKVTNIYYNVVKTLKNRADKLYENYLASA